MMGLMVLGVLVVYLLVSIWVTKKATNWAKANNKKPWVWGGLAAFMMYNLVFWDLIPTLVMHKYYCATQAGFWVYKTPEQWMKENPEMKEGVEYKEQSTERRTEKYANAEKVTARINQRSSIESAHIYESMLPLLRVVKEENTLTDTRDNFILLRKISFRTGSFNFYRINLEQCDGKNGNISRDIWLNIRNKFTNLGEQK